ncbi:hypothetical protein HDU67_005981, partial [Dinochytrium kinnereticum]
VPDEDSFDDFICKECVGSHPFLTGYVDTPLFHFQLFAETGGKPSLKRKGNSGDEEKSEDRAHKEEEDELKIEGKKLKELEHERQNCEKRSEQDEKPVAFSSTGSKDIILDDGTCKLEGK